MNRKILYFIFLFYIFVSCEDNLTEPQPVGENCNSLNYLSDLRFDEINYLNVSNQDIDIICSVLYNFVELTELDLSLNHIEHITTNFLLLDKIIVLNLNYNLFVDFPSVLNDLEIAYLFIKNNKLSSLDNYKMEYIEQINISKNYLKHLNANLFNSKLRWLHANDNQIITISDSIRNSLNLQRLELSNNQIKDLPVNLKYCRKLNYLYLDYNKIEIIPNIFDDMEDLDILNLSYNSIYDIPESITELKNLTILYLHNNKIKKLPDDISKLKNLEILSLYNNQFPEEEKQRIIKALPNTNIFF